MTFQIKVRGNKEGDIMSLTWHSTMKIMIEIESGVSFLMLNNKSKHQEDVLFMALGIKARED